MDAAGIEKVLRATVREAGDLSAAVKPLSKDMGAAVTAAGGSAAITAALTDLLDDHAGRMKAIGTRTTAAVTGAYKAAKAYGNSDAEMVQNAQRAAVRAARKH